MQKISDATDVGQRGTKAPVPQRPRQYGTHGMEHLGEGGVRQGNGGGSQIDILLKCEIITSSGEGDLVVIYCLALS